MKPRDAQDNTNSSERKRKSDARDPMAKKKRQGGPSNAGSDGSSESSEDVRGGYIDCGHVNKAVDLGRVKKQLQKNGLSKVCELCTKQATPPPVETSPEAEKSGDFMEEMDESLWLCLQCGHQACGRYKNKHALCHHNQPHSDSHCLCLNTSKWSVWCYHCDNEVNINGKRKLQECVEYVKKVADANRPPTTNSNNLKDPWLDLSETQAVLQVVLNHNSNPSKYVARGLVNLGNTCFFNSVMQCLGQTPYLLKLLEETAEQGQRFVLPGGKVCINANTKQTLLVPELEGVLDQWKHISRTLAELIRELQSGCHTTFNPSTFFGYLTQRLPVFGGGDQHDAHELLRHLLEAVREEDLRRYQSEILRHLNLNTKVDPSTVEGDTRAIIRFYGSQASELLLPTEQVFRGILVSTLQCQECKHTSHREEFFLDLSLPIAEKQHPPVQRRRAEDKPSKHQKKKELKIRRKNAEGGYVNNSNATLVKEHNADFNGHDVTLIEYSSNDKSDSQSDADVEDNVDDSANSRTSEEANKGAQTESGYNSDKNSPDNISAEAASPGVGMLSASLIMPDSPVTSPASSETNIGLGSPPGEQNSHIENEGFERPESRLAFVGNKNNDLKADLAKLSIESVTLPADAACGGVSVSDHEDDVIIAANNSEDEQMDADDTDMYCGTISIADIADGECSVQSCLNQFTTSELMTGNNKVRCDRCSSRLGGPQKKTVLTNATKQLLIYSPPAVLILHLKRFHVSQNRPSKITKPIKFPLRLDIAPFCSKRTLRLPTFEPNQAQVLYQLYGVVEHSGSIHGGHYVAFVKVRNKLTDDNYRWDFLPKNHRHNINKCIGNANVTEGRWFYVSDTHASAVPEARVLSASAYLLFYERIF